MDVEERDTIARFYQNVVLDAIDPEDSRYVNLYEQTDLLDDDPVTALADVITLTPGSSVQLLSGYRGSGKTTQLRRLRSLLESADEYKVLLIDVEKYLNTAVPVDITDFLMAIAGAFDDAMPTEHKQHVWDHLASFLARMQLTEFELSAPLTGARLRGGLRQSTEFTDRLRRATSAGLMTLVSDVRDFVGNAVRSYLDANPSKKAVVLIVDSVEHYRGTSTTEVDVQSSIERLFGNHSEKLQFDSLHVLYTVPPYLKVKIPNLPSFYEPGAKLQVIPAVKVADATGRPFDPGLDALERLVAARGPIETIFGDSEDGLLRQLCRQSGGHLRDLLRLVQEVLLRARRSDRLPVDARTVKSATDAIARAMLPIADSDARRLWRIHSEHDSPLDDISDLPSFARLLDTHLILCYRNGREWYDVHPLLLDDISDQVARIQRRVD